MKQLYGIVTPFYYTSPQDSSGVLWFHVGRPCVHLSVCCTYLSFIRLSVFSLLMGKLSQFLTELSACHRIVAGHHITCEHKIYWWGIKVSCWLSMCPSIYLLYILLPVFHLSICI